MHILQGHTGRVNSIKLTDLNHTAVTVSDDFTARVWDYSTGQCRHVLAGHGAWVSDMALLASSAKAITVSGDDLAVVWDLEEGKCCNVLEGHSAEVNSVVLTRRGRCELHPLLPFLDAVVMQPDTGHVANTATIQQSIYCCYPRLTLATCTNAPS